MSDKQNNPNNPANDDKKKGLEPDPETLHTTDPQEHMKGPVSSTVRSVEKEVEKGNEESKPEADRKKEENM
jgi:hypothetical protein